jgi:hypothetical protein
MEIRRKQKRLATGKLIVRDGQRSKLEDALASLPTRLKLTADPEYADGAQNRTTVRVPFSYGPYFDKYESNVRKMVQKVLDRVGTTARVEIEHFRRHEEVLDERFFANDAEARAARDDLGMGKRLSWDDVLKIKEHTQRRVVLIGPGVEA